MRGRRLLAAAAAAIAVLGALVGYGLHEARGDPVMRSARIVMPGLPAGQPPLRLALLSDIHIGNFATTPERLDRVVAAINAVHPDIVVIAGDSVNGDYRGDPKFAPGLLAAPLARLRAPLGVFATMGNHDTATDPTALRRVLDRSGVTVLVNSAARAGPFAIAGIDDAPSGKSQVAKTLAAARRIGGVPIVVTHSPTIVKWLHGIRVPLLLMGHTHCGQVALHLAGESFYPTELIFGRNYPKAMRCGIARVAGRLSVVTGGIGTTSAPLRYGAPPDWWLLTLVPEARAAPRP